MSLSLLTRMDDFGSSHSANQAILDIAGRGDFIRNISCMAPGPLMEAGAARLRGHKRLCLGMHLTLNAEWDLVRWPPVSPPETVPSLLAPDGAFMDDPSCFTQTPPRLEEIRLEMDAQLDLLTRLGLDIRYVDSHMLPERALPGLSGLLADWARQKGLINHIPYYRAGPSLEPRPFDNLADGRRHFLAWLEALEDGQYFLVTHPAMGGRDMLLCRRPGAPAPQVLLRRQAEHALLASGVPEAACARLNIRCLRYDEASPQHDSAWMKGMP